MGIRVCDESARRGDVSRGRGGGRGSDCESRAETQIKIHDSENRLAVEAIKKFESAPV